jgi:hypothetical protein
LAAKAVVAAGEFVIVHILAGRRGNGRGRAPFLSRPWTDSRAGPWPGPVPLARV